MNLILLFLLITPYQLLLIVGRIVIPVFAKLLGVDLFYGFSSFFMIGILL